jgi:hypothetical protein
MEHPGRKQSHAVYTDDNGKLVRPRPLFDSCAIVARRHDLVRHLPRTLLELRTRGKKLFGPATLRPGFGQTWFDPKNKWGPVCVRPGFGISAVFGQKVFDECCVGFDAVRAYRRGHAECVAKACTVARDQFVPVSGEYVARVCRDWGDVETANNTQHLFPDDVKIRGKSIQWDHQYPSDHWIGRYRLPPHPWPNRRPSSPQWFHRLDDIFI